MGSIIKLGKYLFAIPFIVFSLFHFMSAGDMAAMAPGGVVMVYIAGAGLLAAGVSIIIGKYDKLAAVLLALLLIIFIVTIHIPGLMGAGDDAMAMQMSMGGLLKDMGLAGGALMYASMAKDNSIIG